MVLLDYVGGRGLRLPREGSSSLELWGASCAPPEDGRRGSLLPALLRPGHRRRPHALPAPGVPAVDLIDWRYPGHDLRDGLDRLSPRASTRSARRSSSSCSGRGRRAHPARPSANRANVHPSGAAPGPTLLRMAPRGRPSTRHGPQAVRRSRSRRARRARLRPRRSRVRRARAVRARGAEGASAGAGGGGGARGGERRSSTSGRR